MAKKVTVEVKELPVLDTKKEEFDVFCSSLSEDDIKKYIKSYYRLYKIQEILKQGDGAKIESKIAAYALLDDMISSLKSLNDELKTSIEHTPLADIKTDLISRGLIEEGEEPVIIADGKVKVKATSVIEPNFAIEKGFLDLADDKYKKVVISIDKDAVKKAYEDGTLESMLKSYVSTRPEETTKITKFKIKKES